MDVKGDACGLRLKQRHPRRSGQAQDYHHDGYPFAYVSAAGNHHLPSKQPSLKLQNIIKAWESAYADWKIAKPLGA